MVGVMATATQDSTAREAAAEEEVEAAEAEEEAEKVVSVINHLLTMTKMVRAQSKRRKKYIFHQNQLQMRLKYLVVEFHQELIFPNTMI